MTRIVFLGTPEAAVPTLEQLNDRFDVGLVITQPDRPKGRSGKPQPSAVSVRATEIGLRTSKPDSAAELHASFSGAGAFDVGVVVAYGRILSSETLVLPKRGLLNLHFSLLPRWRGAAPVARALMAGDTMTGVTIIRIDEGLDTGDVLTAQAVDISPTETAGSLTDRLAHIGAALMADILGTFVSGELEPVPQSDEGLTYASKLTSAERQLTTKLSASDFINQVRGLAPRPSATLRIGDDVVKILVAVQSDRHVELGRWQSVDGIPVVGVNGGSVELRELQPPGKKPMSGESWLRGRQQTSGSVE